MSLSALGITGVMVVIWVFTVVWIKERPSFPSLVHGSFRVSSKWMRAAWAIALLFALAKGGPTIARLDQPNLPASVSIDLPDFWTLPDIPRSPHPFGGQVVGGKGSAIRFGSYGRAYYSWNLRDGKEASYSITELRLPLYFPIALFLLWLIVGRYRDDGMTSDG